MIGQEWRDKNNSLSTFIKCGTVSDRLNTRKAEAISTAEPNAATWITHITGTEFAYRFIQINAAKSKKLPRLRNCRLFFVDFRRVINSMNPFFFALCFVSSHEPSSSKPIFLSLRCCYFIRFVSVFFSLSPLMKTIRPAMCRSQLPFFWLRSHERQNTISFSGCDTQATNWHSMANRTTQTIANKTVSWSPVSGGHCLLVNSLIWYNFDGFFFVRLAFPHTSHEICYGCSSEQPIPVFRFVSVFKTLRFYSFRSRCLRFLFFQSLSFFSISNSYLYKMVFRIDQ